MCFLTEEQRLDVDYVLSEYVEAQIPFTGWDIAKKLPSLDSREVSSFVREIYNAGKIEGYCSTCVDTTLTDYGRPVGPLLYFPRPAKIENLCQKIREKINGKA